jgi:antitoxin ParD1/3/4
MPRLTVDVSEADAEFIESQVTAGRGATRTEVVAGLIREARERAALEYLDQLVREGLDSGPPIPVTDEYWERRRQAFLARHPEAR